MSLDTAPPPANVRYKLTKKVFWKDQLLDPATMPDPHIWAPPGLKGAAFKLAPLPSSAAAPALGNVTTTPPSLNDDTALKRIAELEALVASGEEAVVTLQLRLDDERRQSSEASAKATADLSAAADRIAEQDKMLKSADELIAALRSEIAAANKKPGNK